MSKIIIDDLLDVTSFLNDANERFQQIADEFNEKVLYRDNPPNEPNGMFNDLDMQENDILNAGGIYAKSLVIGGVPFDGAVNWGNIGGAIPDQVDLEARLQQAETAGVHSLEVGDTRLTSLGLEMVDLGGGDFEIQYTDRVNSEAFGLITLNEFGKVPTELLSASAILLLGFFRGDDLCPKDIDNAGLPGIPATPCNAPDFRNPSEIFGGFPYETGHAYVVSFEPPETIGKINLVNPADPVGPIIPTDVIVGDMIVYIEAVSIGNTVVSQPGWYLWAQAVQINTADGVIYDPAGNIIIEPTSTNVDLALTDLDAKCAEKTYVDGQDTALGSLISTNTNDILTNANAILANEGNISANALAIIDNANAIAAQDVLIQANTDAINTKLPATQFATPDSVTPGIVRTLYDAGTNTLTIFSS